MTDTIRITRQSDAERAKTLWREVEVTNWDHRPSWRRYGTGTAIFKLSACVRGPDRQPAVDISASEGAYSEGANARYTSKQVMMSFTDEAALALYEVLREAFEPVTEESQP
jgi:hypothetical protein